MCSRIEQRESACSNARSRSGAKRPDRRQFYRQSPLAPRPLCYVRGLARRYAAHSFEKEAHMQDKRALMVHFTDGSTLSFDFPKQAPNEFAAALALDEILSKRYLLVEADGALLTIPFDNVKYLQVYPMPKKLPGLICIKGATVPA
jgi:hypothetical protein